MTSRLALEYDGAPFAGWAVQPDEPTVQGEVESVLATILGEPVALTVAGRTDRGVHAWGQVASYPAEALDPVRLNSMLPASIAVLSCEPAATGFDARTDARSRTYCYRLLNRRARSALQCSTSLHFPMEMDRGLLDACAAQLAGSHDFTAFTPSDSGHSSFAREVLSARWDRDGDMLAFWIEADSFLRHMNRILIGTMLEVARGRRTFDQFRALLAGAPRSAAGPTAPAHGLALASVRY